MVIYGKLLSVLLNYEISYVKVCVKGKVVFFLSLGFNVYVSGFEIKFYFYLYVYIDVYDKVFFYNLIKVLKIF